MASEDVKVAAIMMTLNEAENLARIRPRLQDVCDWFQVVDGGSTDGTPQIAAQFANEVMDLPRSGDMGHDRNVALHRIHKRYTWILWVDADEKFDMEFLVGMKKVVARYPVSAFSFPRVNLPDAKNYPDYQVRFHRNLPDIHWVGETHETLYKGDVRLDQVGVRTLDLYPIIHLPRRTDLKRSWW